MNTPTIKIENVKLMAREERRLPSGASPNPNRDIGFASVFLRLENPQLETVTLTIQKIEIVQVSDNTVELSSPESEEIQLQPLENAEKAFYLTNKIGYSAEERVKAVITYQVGEQINVIESEPVNIDRL